MICLTAVVVVIFSVWYNFYWKRRRFPPGPLPLPLLGNILQIAWHYGPELWQSLHARHGDIFTLWLGPTPVVLVNDVDTVRELLTGKTADALAGRPIANEINAIARGGNHGIVFTDGPLWKEQRRFVLKVLHEYGLGRHRMQQHILDEVELLIDDVKNHLNTGAKVIDLHDLMDYAVGNIIGGFLFGHRFDDKKQFCFFKDTITTLTHRFSHPVLMLSNFSSIRWFQKIPYTNKVIQEVLDLHKNLYDYFGAEVKEHAAKIDFSSDEEPKDYIEAFLRHRHRLNSQSKSEDTFSGAQLGGMILDLWMAGQETTSTTLGWIVLYLMTHSQIQDKLHQELDREIASDRLITVENKPQLHYLQAIIHESQRVCNLIPLNVPHRTTRDIQIGCHTIPADTIVFPQISSVLQNESFFPDGSKFDPSRFLDKQKKFAPNPNVIPFSLGKRRCAGEPLAALELFLITANVFNQFRVSIDEINPPDVTRVLGGTVQPRPYVCKIQARY